ncbi:sec1 family transport protein [Strigomonas culicis]|uniref:Sec1 family transport protein n=1 Tax=Strigomonas culicis TaxID=28005 RepID=S9VTY8_9TRYP|nr:sec1 family transport protein [Strigomonas culicis]|eukprot:EPY26695.1 sec1 family transport protein [Strigomonas culicis]
MLREARRPTARRSHSLAAAGRRRPCPAAAATSRAGAAGTCTPRRPCCRRPRRPAAAAARSVARNKGAVVAVRLEHQVRDEEQPLPVLEAAGGVREEPRELAAVEAALLQDAQLDAVEVVQQPVLNHAQEAHRELRVGVEAALALRQQRRRRQQLRHGVRVRVAVVGAAGALVRERLVLHLVLLQCRLDLAADGAKVEVCVLAVEGVVVGIDLDHLVLAVRGVHGALVEPHTAHLDQQPAVGEGVVQRGRQVVRAVHQQQQRAAAHRGRGHLRRLAHHVVQTDRQPPRHLLRDARLGVRDDGHQLQRQQHVADALHERRQVLLHLAVRDAAAVERQKRMRQHQREEVVVERHVAQRAVVQADVADRREPRVGQPLGEVLQQRPRRLRGEVDVDPLVQTVATVLRNLGRVRLRRRAEVDRRRAGHRVPLRLDVHVEGDAERAEVAHLQQRRYDVHAPVIEDEEAPRRRRRVRVFTPAARRGAARPIGVAVQRVAIRDGVAAAVHRQRGANHVRQNILLPPT